MNTAVIVGRVGQDAEMRYFDENKIRTRFSVAVNRWDSKTKSEITDWFNIEVWDKQAEFAGEYVKKGRLVAVDGRIQISTYTDSTGAEKQWNSIVANRVRLLGSRSEVQQ